MYLNFLASLATIISIIFAMYVFLSDKCYHERKEKQEYINKLNSLDFELQKNNQIILNFFNKNKDLYLGGKKVAYFRYSTNVSNNLIADGSILDTTLLRNLDAIIDNKNQVNRILDLVALMADVSQINSVEQKQLFENRIKTAYSTIFILNDEIEKYLPKVLANLKEHIEKTSTIKNHWFCFKKHNFNKLDSTIFD